MMAPATHWHDEVVDILKYALRQIAPRSVVIATEKGVDLGRTVPEPMSSSSHVRRSSPTAWYFRQLMYTWR